MTAEIREKIRTTKYFEVRCPECDDLYLGQERTIRGAQLTQELHDSYVHTEPPRKHHIRHSTHRGILGGWSVECICGYFANTDYPFTWKCPLDRSGS